MYHRGPEWTCRSGVCCSPYVGGIGVANGRGDARKRDTGVGRAHIVVSGAAGGDGGTEMLEGTSNGDGDLKGSEHEFSPLDIYFESVSFY